MRNEPQDIDFGAKAKPVGAIPNHEKTPLQQEAERIAAMKAAFTRPSPSGEVFAPAAGPKALVPEYEIMTGGTRRQVSAHWRDADVFDAMQRDAALAHHKSGEDTTFVPPFTHGHLHIARHYRALTEKHDASGYRCSSLEPGRGGGGSGGDFTLDLVSDAQRLARMHRQIGTGVAMSVRRVRPSDRGSPKAKNITNRALVDAVCLGQKTLGAVLKEWGWSIKGNHRMAMRGALAAALDRMQG